MVISVQASQQGKKTLSDVMWLSWINGAIRAVGDWRSHGLITQAGRGASAPAGNVSREGMLVHRWN